MNPIKKITNSKIIEKQNIRGQTYYIIFNQDAEERESYFCFENILKSDGSWEQLKNNWQSIKEIEFEYELQEKGNKVITIINHDQNEDIFI